MINFVIVEDNKLHMDRTKDMINKYMMRNNYEYKILGFFAPNDDFNKVINKENNCIYILDFELGGTNAIDVARTIRKKDWDSPIIVFTVNGGMALETFKQRLQILDFVAKQFDAEQNMFQLFDICMDQFKLKKNFKYKLGTVDYTIEFDKILYIYKDTVERKSVIVTDKSEEHVPLSLTKIKDLLPEYFVYSHKSCIINKRRAIAYDWAHNMITFDNGHKEYLLSKKHKEEILG